MYYVSDWEYTKEIMQNYESNARTNNVGKKGALSHYLSAHLILKRHALQSDEKGILLV